MHPLTIYDIAMLEHEHASAQRNREHLRTLRRRERQSALPTPRRTARAAHRTARSATA